MADLAKLVEELGKMTVMEAAELTKMLEAAWGVSAATPGAMGALPAGGGGAGGGRGMKAAGLTKRLGGAWGVSAAPPVAVAAMPAGGGAAAEAVEEKTEFDVILKDVGPKKIDVIKVIRQITSLGLKDAKDMAEASGAKVLEAASKDAAG